MKNLSSERINVLCLKSHSKARGRTRHDAHFLLWVQRFFGRALAMLPVVTQGHSISTS